MNNFLGFGTQISSGMWLLILAVVLVVAITTKSSAKNEAKSRAEWKALPDGQRPAHGMVDNSPSNRAVIAAIIVALLIAYLVVNGGM